MENALVGTRLGAYELQHMLGSGGMAAVYQAFDHNLHRTVAVKLLTPAAALQPGFADRFQQEARLVARLHHPNIVQVYDFGQQDAITYMVQELLPGPTLAHSMQERHANGQRMGRDDVLAIIGQLAAGLDAAHAEGIIHRDVKPANALWNASGVLVLTDFGIAKPSLESGKLTQVGMILGTPAYLSPEQAQGLPLSPASDVYALGVILYELLTGRVPFDGAMPMQVLWQHVHDPVPSVLTARPDLPPAVGDVLERALAKDALQRYSRAGDLAMALANAWPATASAVQLSPAIDQEPTRVWLPPAAAPATDATIALASAARPAPAAVPRNPRLLPVLGAILALVVLCGGALAVRGAVQRPQANQDAAGEMPTGRATVSRDDTLTSLATAVPVPAVPSPFDTLRASLTAGIQNGRAGNAGAQLLGHLDAAQAAIDGELAGQAAAELQAFLATLHAHDEIDPALATELSAQVEQIATSYQLVLVPAELPAPPAGDSGDSGDKGDKGEQGGNGKDDNDKGKGKKDD